MLARFGLEPVLLGALFLVGVLAAGFLGIAEEMTEGETHAADLAVLLAFRAPDDPADPLGPPWVEEMARDVTALGGISVMTLAVGAAAGFLLLRGRRRAAALLVVGVAGGLVLGLLLKAGFDRPRPDLVPHGSVVYTSSFPSGHSMMAAVAWLSLGALVAQALPGVVLRSYVLALAITITVLVGVSRVYLGVHWPSDVLAGWVAGAAWALATWAAGRWLEGRGRS